MLPSRNTPHATLRSAREGLPTMRCVKPGRLLRRNFSERHTATQRCRCSLVASDICKRCSKGRAVLPARPSGPAPVLGDTGRVRGEQSRRKTRFASAGRVVQLVRCGEVASPWHASMHVGQSSPLACCSAPDQGRRKIHFIHSEITDSHLAIIVLKALCCS